MKDIIISNSFVDIPGQSMTVTEFVDIASSSEGFNIKGDLYVNIEDINQKLYNAIKEAKEDVIFFTMNQVPEWAEVYEIKNLKKEEIEVNEDFISSTFEEPTSIAKEDVEVFIAQNALSNSEDNYDSKNAIVYLFGSSKGGSGKTFSCLISAYRFAKKNPHLKVAISDFDIIDGQIGVAIHKISPTMLNFYKEYKQGFEGFNIMKNYKVKHDKFPKNVDFYLAPKDVYIRDDMFWERIFSNLIQNYDVVFFDSGIDYMNYKPISTLYKIADKIILTSTTSIKSVASVVKQIKKLHGGPGNENEVFTPEDEIHNRLNLIITQAIPSDSMNNIVFDTFKKERISILATFGNLTSDIQEAEYKGKWDVFDNNKKFNESLDKITECP